MALVLSAISTAALAENLNCDIGPLTKTYGRSNWLVYSCHDDSNIVVVTASGNPAMPFYFSLSLSLTKDGIHLHGEGTGRKDLTDAAYKDLGDLSEKDITAVIAETKAVVPASQDDSQSKLGH